MPFKGTCHADCVGDMDFYVDHAAFFAHRF